MSMRDEREIQERRPLWVALSELWLDTELSAEDLERIARVMADSGLAIDQLREVYLVEVAPVVSANLLQVAGEWAGFDEEWLCAQCPATPGTRTMSGCSSGCEQYADPFTIADPNGARVVAQGSASGGVSQRTGADVPVDAAFMVRVHGGVHTIVLQQEREDFRGALRSHGVVLA
jgi:hypothetical protein